jgi:uncharacterized membrane protein
MVGVQGNALVPLALLGSVPLISWLFGKVHPGKAAAIAFVLAWMFLPVASIPLKGLPDFTKVTVTCTAILLAAWMSDRQRLLSFRFMGVDMPMLLWCTCPFLSSVVNGLGAYDGISESMYQSFTWGLPYFVARIYFSDLHGLHTLGTVVFLGGLLYIPFCFVEMIMSPQLHRWTYGFHQHSILQSMRDGGFRPMVYMEHGLMVAMWMVSGSILGIWMNRAKILPDFIGGLPWGGYVRKIPFRLLLAGLIATTFLMRSSGALFLFIIGLGVLFISTKTKSVLLVWLLLAIPPAYMVSRGTGWWTGENLSSAIADKFSAERAQSLQFRFDNETMLVKKALAGTFFGWGGWNRSRVFDQDGRDLSVTDGLWIITLGTKGIYGLILLTLVITLPVYMLLYRSTPGQWRTAEYGAVSAMSVLLALYMIDNLLNGMVNPIFMLFNGGICGLLAKGVPGRAVVAEIVLAKRTSPITEDIRWINETHRPLGTRFLTAPREKK